MTGANKGIVRSIVTLSAILALALPFAGTSARAEPVLLVYPSSITIFRFDPGRYFLVQPGQANYDSRYAVANQMLWDYVAGRIPYEINRAPGLAGFEPSAGGGSEYHTLSSEFDLIVDGFSDRSRTLTNLRVRFQPLPYTSEVSIEIDGGPIGWPTHRINNLTVSTPIGDGNYSDTVQHRIRWSGTETLRIVVFADKNLNGLFDDGPPLVSVLAVGDLPLPVEETSWGAIKALYGR